MYGIVDDNGGTPLAGFNVLDDAAAAYNIAAMRAAVAAASRQGGGKADGVSPAAVGTDGDATLLTPDGDFVLSNDGATIYAIGANGAIDVIDASSGAVLRSIAVGIALGAIDISIDDGFLIATEQVPVSYDYKDLWWNT